MSNTEIVVVGAGVAGLSAALAVAGTGHDVTLVTKAELVESNTYHAQGGIAAAIFSDDDPKLHAADTMAAGHGLCDPKAVDILTREGAERVREFAAAGVHFDRDAHGHMLRGLEAAHSRARVVHAGGDATGKVFELDVSAMVRKNPRIHIIENAFLKDLIVRGGHIAGVHLLIDGQDKDLAADRVILAAGGAGRMYPYTTNPPVATADGLAVAWRAGAQVADLEFYQFHPTAMAVGEHFLVSEAVRGEGAVLLDEHGHRYMKDIDPRAELAPRDVVARENFRVMQAQGGKPVMLDFTGYGCVNCRKMELAVWTDSKVSDIINNDYVLITLYVDNKTPLPSPVKIVENGTERTLRTVGDKWSYLQRVKFGANAQPFYVLIDNEGKPLNKSYSYDEDIPKYIEFLQTGLENYKKEK